MTVEEALASALAGNTGVSALVDDRVYVLKLPQAPTYPAIRIEPINEPLDHHARGRTDLRRSEVQITAFDAESSGGDPYAGVVAVAAAIDDAIDGVVGFNDGSPAAVRILSAARVSRRADLDPDELCVVSMILEYVVWSKAA